MSRTSRAAVSSAFTYFQFAISMFIGLAVIKITLARVGTREYGLWLTSGEVLGYAGLLDVGVFGLLPWLVAKADGEGDRSKIRSLIKHSVWIGIAVAILYAGFFAICWNLLPNLLKLTVEDRHVLRAPLFLLVGSVSLTYPFKVLDALLVGLQDVKFTGMMSLIQLLTTSAVELGMLYFGFGLMSLAVASTLNVFIAGSFGLWRVHKIAPDLLSNWPAFEWPVLAHLLGDGTGVWVSNFGVQLMAASAGMIITFNGHPEWVPIYAVTAKLALIITQISWVLPDSGLVGLSQLYGSNDRERVPGVVQRMLEFHLLLSTAAASLILSLNPAFVKLWVGPQVFAGFSFNAASAALIVASSLIHGLICSAGVLGDRKQIGLMVVMMALIQFGLAAFLTPSLGLVALPLAAIVAQLTLPPIVSLRLLRKRIGLDVAKLIRAWLRIIVLQIAPVLTLAWYSGRVSYQLPIWKMVIVQCATSAAVVLLLLPMVRSILEDPRVRSLILRLRAMGLPLLSGA